MKAALLEAFGKPLRVAEVPRPVPERGEVVVKMSASGVCHSDLHNINGDWPFVPNLPIVPGHEGVGVVSELGADVTAVKEGDRVAVWFYNSTCGECTQCLAGEENYCDQKVMSGFSVDGSFAEEAKLAGDFAIKIPDGLSDVEAAPLTDAGLSAWRALKAASVSEGDPVAVFGIGGVGHLALQFAKMRGASVIAVDMGEEKLKMAEELGADRVLDASDAALGSEIRYEMGGVKVALCCAPSMKAYSQALSSLRPTGTLVAVGLPAGNLELSVLNTVFFGTHIVGSLIGTREDLRETLGAAAKGRVKSLCKTYEFAEVNGALDDLSEGKVLGRPVLTFGGS